MDGNFEETRTAPNTSPASNINIYQDIAGSLHEYWAILTPTTPKNHTFLKVNSKKNQHKAYNEWLNFCCFKLRMILGFRFHDTAILLSRFSGAQRLFRLFYSSVKNPPDA